MTDNNQSLFCFGLGYTALALAREFAKDRTGKDWRIAGTCHSEEKCEDLRSEGIDAFVFSADHVDGGIEDALGGASHVLVTIPPDREGDPVLAAFSDALADHPGLNWLGYLSTTGVYGDHAGGWVDEATAPKPSSERGRRRLEVEAAWLRLQADTDLPVHIFRLAGIYGPGRNVLKRLLAGTAQRIVKDGHVFSRAHIDDIVATLVASMARPNPGATYNIADDEPASQSDTLVWAAEQLGVEVPPATPIDDPDLSDAMRSFYADCRRVSNARIKEELGIELKFPDYRAGGLSNIALDVTGDITGDIEKPIKG